MTQNIAAIVFFVLLQISQVLAMDSRRVKIDDNLTTPYDKSIEILTRATENENPLIRMNAIETIVISGCKPLYPLIEQMLSDDEDAVRFAAALGVGDVRYKSAAVKLAELYNSTDVNEKMAASYALIMLGDEGDEYHRILIQGLQDKDETTSANAAMIIGKLGIKKYAGLLRWTIQNNIGNDKTQIQAIESLAMLGDLDVISRAWALLISKRADDRVMGIITMYRIGSYDAVNAIKTMLEDSVLEVRLIAAGRLEALGNNSARYIITDFFDKDLQTISSEDRSRALIHALDAVRFSRDYDLASYAPLFLRDKSISVQIHAAAAVLSISSGV